MNHGSGLTPLKLKCLKHQCFSCIAFTASARCWLDVQAPNVCGLWFWTMVEMPLSTLSRSQSFSGTDHGKMYASGAKYGQCFCQWALWICWLPLLPFGPSGSCSISLHESAQSKLAVLGRLACAGPTFEDNAPHKLLKRVALKIQVPCCIR